MNIINSHKHPVTVHSMRTQIQKQKCQQLTGWIVDTAHFQK